VSTNSSQITEPTVELANPNQNRSLPTGIEFIEWRMVVAAGWAVDDAAALTFATVFWSDVESIPFGEAVKEARTTTFDSTRPTRGGRINAMAIRTTAWFARAKR
jgi:hypothetical protein